VKWFAGADDSETSACPEVGQRVLSDIHELEPVVPIRVTPHELRMEGLEPFGDCGVQISLCHDQQVNVTDIRHEAADDRRAIQIHGDQIRSEGESKSIGQFFGERVRELIGHHEAKLGRFGRRVKTRGLT
jgi:hypothetical protein